MRAALSAASINAALIIAALVIAGGARAEVLRFHADLTATDAAGRGAGRADATLDTETGALSWRITYGGLSGPVVGARLLAPPEPGEPRGGLDSPRPYASPIAASAQIGNAEIGDLRAGLWSVVVMTARAPGGEIRGELIRAR
jgi:hypothetical protein